MFKSGVRKSLPITYLAALVACQISVPQLPDPGLLAQIHRQSVIKSTGKATDFAIDGVGFFKLIDPKTKKVYYTRNGAFLFDSNNTLASAQGYLFEPTISVQRPDQFVFLSEGGGFWGKVEPHGWVDFGRLTLTRFPKPEALKALAGRDGLYEATDAAGKPEEGQAAQNDFGKTLSGALEDFATAAVSLPASGCQKPSGKLETTQNKLDWHIEGSGFFALLDPSTGERYLSRQAHLRVNPNGQLISYHGYFLDPAMVLPPFDTAKLDFASSFNKLDADGSLWVKTSDGKETKLGKVMLVMVERPEKLINAGFTRATVFKITPEAGKILDIAPGQAGAGTLKSGAYESCGKDLISRPEPFLESVVTGGL